MDVDAPILIEPRALARARALGSETPVRAWTPLGTVDAGAIADVDAAGLVQLRGEQWSLDWWIGAEDRWHHPSQDAAVRQRDLGDCPVVETSMRVPGGDVVQRVFGVRATSVAADGASTWDDSGVVIEVENLTAVPVALAFVVRPFTLDGVGSTTQLDSRGPVVLVDGRVGAVLSKPIARRVSGPVGTVAARLAAADDAEPDARLTSDGTAIESAYVVALPHTAVVRVLLPRPSRREPGFLGRRTRSTEVEPGAHWDAPSADAIQAGWAAHTRDAARVALPEQLLDQVVAASERTLAIAATDGFFDGGAASDGTPGSSAARRGAELCDTLVRTGVSEPLGPIARALVGSQRLGGALRMSDGSDATVALVHAAAPLLVGSRREAWGEELVGPVARAIHRIERGKGLEGPDGAGLTRSAATALGRVAPSLRAAGQPEVAAAAETLALRLWSSVRPATAGAAGPSTTPPSTRRELVAEAVRLRDDICTGDETSVVRALALDRIGRPGVVGDLVDPDGAPCGDRGLDPAAIAARLGGVLDLALGEGPDGLAILPAWTPAWFGQSAEAHAVRTRWGAVSYAVRWHGERPAILWEIEPAEGIDAEGPAPTLGAPALDPTWSVQEWSGEALLAAMEPPEGMTPTIIGHDHQLSGQRTATEAEPLADEARATAAEPEPSSFPGEGQSFS